MEDVVLSPAAIAPAEVEEREEEEEGERGCKEGDKEGEEMGEEDGGKDRGIEGGDGNEEKNGYSTAHRYFVERIKEKQGKLESAMVLLVVEALGLCRLRFVKAEAEADSDKQHSLKPEVCRTSQRDDIQQEISRAEEDSADGSLGITSYGSSDGVGKDEEQVKMSMNELGMNEESGRECGSIDLEKEDEEEEEEKVDGDMKLILKKYKEQKQKDEIIHEVLEKWTQKLLLLLHIKKAYFHKHSRSGRNRKRG
ncbi:uncharacterized protein MONOS_2878 [Monocercomonoides exilis]|uniref:uncharacterized protein n=1 Tax=Monocercomonoides exilis TaxID=2049356 RepID=UPI00355979E1|nr:hypothetical protein MONOS_2878 [Monocercomonoides exilis]|eukprot:MONOS_2878.1-p1 / transcript=MONOS_2878.1 / gene=MONOS_2878 / organism=Monocercomonoides_exilis_PA203 / gene_product=unspecified product / transcript_product=unspecified product / location=Mono_scaffold00062:127353-128108(+) / protein_length=252 / sequence_SO=supercontig / SO=protein_coding / is_pseudo=false